MNFPPAVQRYLRRLCIESKTPAFLRVRPDGLPAEAGGEFAFYGLPTIRKDVPAAQQIDFLEGLLPLGDDAMRLPYMQTPAGKYVDLHLFPGEEGDWVLLLDSSDEARQLFRLQQSAHEVLLLRASEGQMHAKVRRSHDALLSIFNQLKLITAIVDAAGRIEFLSETGQHFFGVSPQQAAGMSWHELIPLDQPDREHIQGLFAADSSGEDRARIHTRLGSGRQCWLEVDVQRDPRHPDKWLLYLYDVSELHDLRRLLTEKTQFQDIVGKSKPMEQVFQLIRDVSRVDSTVLIEGETGTGKELVARAIHFSSHRRDGPFITVNCAGLSDSLINSQLFGHKKGAFTDAVSDQEGVFEAANGGTIFLDEIGDVPMNTQTRLLRVLEQKEIVRIGETKARAIDIRILAATNKNLTEEVEAKRFRLDLLYRIRVARVLLPPLQRRREDIPILVEAFLGLARAVTGKEVERVNADAMRLLLDHSWPGNVRELKNAIEFAVIRCRGDAIQPVDLPPEIIEARSPSVVQRAEQREREAERIRQALEETAGNRGEAARHLGISRATLYRRIKACGLDTDELPGGRSPAT